MSNYIRIIPVYVAWHLHKHVSTELNHIHRLVLKRSVFTDFIHVE